MRFSAVIFDNDGVCVDSETLSGAVDASVLTEIGYPMTGPEATRMALGLTHEAFVEMLTRDKGWTLPADFLERTHRGLVEAYKTQLRPIAGVAELMRALRIPYAVASNSPPSKLGLGLACTDLFELLYPHIYSAVLVKRGKPAPDLFLLTAQRLGIPPGDCVVIEDSIAGVTAAKAAGMTCIGFTGGSHQGPDAADRLRGAGADIIAPTMADARAMIEN